ncbi:MAG: zinc-binding alcohol dehydrogenase family protein [Gammaproteobacteria bacterium]|nr:zinc-binding alcohol dehydrogenase family protein [Gammaproteobacteria bacterium]
MKAIGYRESLPISDANALLDVTLPDPSPAGRDLLVRIKAVAVNPVDTKIRKRAQPEPGGIKVLGWDACGVVEAVGSECTLFKAGDEVWYAGAVNRQGTNAELHLVDERIVGRKPRTLDDAHAAAMPLTTITAWEILFDRLQIMPGKRDKGECLLIVGAAGGVGSMLTQLAARLTGLTVIGTASRAETRDWVLSLGAHHVIDHSKPLAAELKNISVENVTHVAALTRSDLHLEQIIESLAPFGKLAMIDDPGPVDFTKLKTKSISLHWELMFTRALFQTADMIEQHRLLNEVAALVDAGLIRSTFQEHYGKINAENLKRAHAMIESGKSMGKIVLEGF